MILYIIDLMFIELPANVKKIIETLEKAGFEAYTGYISNFLKNIGIE